MQIGLAQQKEVMKKIQSTMRFPQKWGAAITDFDEAVIGRLIEPITIEEGRIRVCFKSGVVIEG